MNGPHGDSGATGRRGRRSSLGDRPFAGHACRRIFNARSGTPFNELQYPTDLVLLAVRWRLRYKRSFRDVAELLLPRGFEVTHETIRAWEFRFAPLLADQLRRKRRGRPGVSWYLDETYVKVAGRWGYLYRAIDGDGDAARLDAERTPGQARGAPLLAAPARGRRAYTATRHDGPSPGLPPSDPLDPGATGCSTGVANI